MNAIKKRRLIKRILLITAPLSLIAVLGILYYLKLTTYPEGIVRPLEEQITFNTKTFDADSGIVFHQPTGTHIVIPARVLVDKEGREVTGDVELKFREFQNANEIFLSGIPMQLGENREKYMSSGGMMELRVEQNGEELVLRNGEEVQVELANATGIKDPDFRMFFLTDDLNWDAGRDFEVVNNDRRDSALGALPAPPIQPINPDPDSMDFIFEIAADYKKMPHLKTWKGVSWKLKDSKGDLTPEQALSVIWSSIDIKDQGEDFEIKIISEQPFYNGKIRKFETKLIASPMLQGEELMAAKEQYLVDLEKYKVILAKLKEEESRLIKEAGVLSKFSISGFGIFNIDKIESTMILAHAEFTFDFEEEINPLINEIMLYVILEEENGVIKFKSHDWNKAPILSSVCSMAAVLPNGTVAYVSSDTYRATVDPDGDGIPMNGTILFKTIRMDYEEFIEDILPTEPDNKSIPSFV